MLSGEKGHGSFLTVFHKFRSTFRASHTHLALSLGNADLLFAVWAGVNVVILSLLLDILFLAEKVTHLILNSEIFLILSITLCNIP